MPMTTAAETFVKPKNTKTINISGKWSGVLRKTKGSVTSVTKAAVVRDATPSPIAAPVMPAFLAATKTEDVLPKGSIARVVRQTNTKAKARAYLLELGLIDKNGKPAAQYR
jgi:hypothetical protein